MRRVLRWLWLPLLALMIATCVIGVKMDDLPEILRNAVILCLSCIGIG
ncbi:hypothetical protein KAX06_08560 [candidate division WOR-3 bacterium]|nr:hypothetical protein [candidate division WOR-3 bacterium]